MKGQATRQSRGQFHLRGNTPTSTVAEAPGKFVGAESLHLKGIFVFVVGSEACPQPPVAFGVRRSARAKGKTKRNEQ